MKKNDVIDELGILSDPMTQSAPGPSKRPRPQVEEVAPMAQPERFARLLLKWYDQGHRTLPFRLQADPYRIWISEIMAQQTRMEVVVPYYERFIKQFPDMSALANADADVLLKAWQGLGYYDRARRMQNCAKQCMEQYGGQLPSTYEELIQLPGIGPYVAGAVASIAFGQRVSAVDGNVIRVFSRITALEQNVSALTIQNKIRAHMDAMVPARAGDFNQALMDLGALICLPKSPKCDQCPVKRLCQAKAQGIQQELPVKTKAKQRPVEKKRFYLLAARDGSRIHLVQNPANGLLAGMYGLDVRLPGVKTLTGANLKGPGEEIPLEGHRHIFTHKEWDMEVSLMLYEPTGPLDHPKGRSNQGGVWMTMEQSLELPIPAAYDFFYQQALKILKVDPDKIRQAAKEREEARNNGDQLEDD